MFANIFKITAGEGFADDVTGWWQVDIFPDRSPHSVAIEGAYYRSWDDAVDYAVNRFGCEV